MSTIPTDHAANELTIIPVCGLGEFRPGQHIGDDLAQPIIDALSAQKRPLVHGDVVVVTSKVFSKIEGRIVSAPHDPDARDKLRRQLVLDEAVRIVAQKNRTLITENKLGVVQAASGIDGSNVAANELALLPKNPDASAQALRAELAVRAGVDVAVIVTDTMGRAWRVGQIDAAIGSSGMTVIHPYHGAVDTHGNPLIVTEIAVADEIAAAADLVKGKVGGVPVAIVRGFPTTDDGSSARDLVRKGSEDLFWLGTEFSQRRTVLLRRSVRKFTDKPVDEEALRAALSQALTSPAPHHSHPIRFVWVRKPSTRHALLNALETAWRDDLTRDGLAPDAIDRRIMKGRILFDCPELVIPFLTEEGRHTYPDHRQDSERTMFTVAGGAAVGTFLISLAAHSLGSCWIGSTIFAPDVTTSVLGLDPSWSPLGAVAIGYPIGDLAERPAAPLEHAVLEV